MSCPREDIVHGVAKLKKKKASGPDGLMAEHRSAKGWGGSADLVEECSQCYSRF